MYAMPIRLGRDQTIVQETRGRPLERAPIRPTLEINNQNWRKKRESFS